MEDLYWIVPLVIVLTALIAWRIIWKRKKYTERLQRLPQIKFTQIIGSSGGDSGTVIVHGNDGADFGTYHSKPTTKFLVVYLDGSREIVTVRDNSRLCREYLMKTKTSNQKS